MRCPKCGNENTKNVRFCRFCGTEMINAEQRTIKCKNTSEPIKNNDEIKDLMVKMLSEFQHMENQFNSEIRGLEKGIEELKTSLARLEENTDRASIDLALYKNRAEKAEVQLSELKKSFRQRESGSDGESKTVIFDSKPTALIPVFPPLPYEVNSETQSNSVVAESNDDSDLNLISSRNTPAKTDMQIDERPVPRTLYCSGCGHPNNWNSRFCQRCGMKITGSN